MTSRRILYAGADTALPGLLKAALKEADFFVVRSPVPAARTLLRSHIEYFLLLFDDDPSGEELKRYARTLSQHERTPIVLAKKAEGISPLVNTLERMLRG